MMENKLPEILYNDEKFSAYWNESMAQSTPVDILKSDVQYFANKYNINERLIHDLLHWMSG